MDAPETFFQETLIPDEVFVTEATLGAASFFTLPAEEVPAPPDEPGFLLSAGGVWGLGAGVLPDDDVPGDCELPGDLLPDEDDPDDCPGAVVCGAFTVNLNDAVFPP